MRYDAQEKDDTVLNIPSNTDDLKLRNGATKRRVQGTKYGELKGDTIGSPKRHWLYGKLYSFIWNDVCTPPNLHKYMPYIFFIEVVLVGSFGVFIAIPHLYSQEDGNALLYNQAFGCVIFLQIICNWLLMQYTDPSFTSSCFPLQTAKLGNDLQELPEFLLTIEQVRPTKQQQDAGLYPYWSWSPCFLCGVWRPPRCHHCLLCHKCVLKRDHHCFFARNCVGYNNQRYFSVFVCWAFTGAVFSSYHALVYFFGSFWPLLTYFDILPFFSFLRIVFGFDHGAVGILVMMGWVLGMLDVICLMQLASNFSGILSGKTSFERDHEIDVKDERKFKHKMAAVFGEWFILSFLFPIPYFVLPSKEDPFHWTTLVAPSRNPLIRILKPAHE